MADHGLSDVECKIIYEQIKRREEYRKQFMKMRTDPFKHSTEAGYVFDPAIQRFMSMKTCQAEYFKACPKTIISGLTMIVMPMLAYGYLIYKTRSYLERQYRCGKIRYRERIHKFL